MANTIYNEWKFNNKTVIATVTKDDHSYSHYCPLIDFKFICIEILNYSSTKDFFIRNDLLLYLEGKKINEHFFNKTKEHYKMRMALGFLLKEKILIQFDTPIDFSYKGRIKPNAYKLNIDSKSGCNRIIDL